MILESLVVPLTLDSKSFTEGIDKAEKSTTNLVNGLSKVGGGLLAGGIGLASAGIAGLTGIIFDSTKNAMEAEKIQAQLNSVLESTGYASGMTSESINDLASSLSELTPFEDDAIVSGENMLLTFTNIGKDVFPLATETMLDLSQAMGQDLKTSAIQLGKALNDPTEGLSSLSRVGVTFTEAQKKQIKAMQEAGDIAGAQKIILAELTREFGGSAKAAGKTFAGQLTILQNKLGNIKESIGSAVIPVIAELANQFSTWLSNPETQAGINNLVTGIASLATTAISYLPIVIQKFQEIGSWLMNNQGVIVGILSALGVAVGAFVYTTIIPAIIATITALAPVLLIMAAVGAAAYLLYEAWNSNFLGIRDTVTNFWNNSLKPVFDILVEWLKTNIPLAIQALSNFWTNTLYPAIQRVWSWMNSTLFPFFRSLGDFLGAVFGVVITALAGIFQNVLLPALRNAYNWLATNVFPILKQIGEWIASRVAPAFDGLSGAISRATQWFRDMANAIRNIHLPSWMVPGSPMPLDWSFRWLGDSIKDVANKALPALNNQLDIQGVISPSAQNIKANENSNVERLLQQLVEKESINERQLAMVFENVLLRTK